YFGSGAQRLCTPPRKCNRCAPSSPGDIKANPRDQGTFLSQLRKWPASHLGLLPACRIGRLKGNRYNILSIRSAREGHQPTWRARWLSRKTRCGKEILQTFSTTMPPDV